MGKAFILCIALAPFGAFSQGGVGVDVPVPLEKLDVAGRLRLASETTAGAPTGGAGTIRWNGLTGQFQGWDGTAWIPFGPGIEVDPTWDGSAIFTGATWRSGDVGLGMTAAPNSKLQVLGRVYIDNGTSAHGLVGNPALVVDGALNENILQVRDVGGNNRLLVNAAGNVGINTFSPTARLSIATALGEYELLGTAASPTFKTNTGGLGTLAGDNLKLASFGFRTNALVDNVSLGIKALRTAAGSTSTTTAIGLTFDVNNASPVNNSEIWLTNAGNVGVGTNAPTAVLDVNGKARSTAIYGVGTRSAIVSTTFATLVDITNLSATVTAQTNDIIKVDCLCTMEIILGGTALMTVREPAGTGTWILFPNSALATGTGRRSGFSTGVFRADADGPVTFQGRFNTTAGTASVLNCNITAVVIGKQ